MTTRRNFFKGIAVLPLAVVAPKAVPAPAVAAAPAAGLFGGMDLSGVFASGSDFVPRDGLAYLHRGERKITFTVENSHEATARAEKTLASMRRYQEKKWGHAIATLQMKSDRASYNALIQESEGRTEQAELNRDIARNCLKAINLLKRGYS